jgi:hypothetical protein
MNRAGGHCHHEWRIREAETPFLSPDRCGTAFAVWKLSETCHSLIGLSIKHFEDIVDSFRAFVWF